MSVELRALASIPEVCAGDDLAELIHAAAPDLADGDIVVVAQKVVSKAEGRARLLSEVEPGEEAARLAAETEKDPRMVQLVLDESRAVLRARPGVIITETRQGFVCANAGIDASNVAGDDTVLLLPDDCDASARALRAALAASCGKKIGVIVSDSFGRAWRVGQTDVALGCAGIKPVEDLRGESDRDGRELTASITAAADELAAAANQARGKASGEPVVIVRGRSDLVIDGDGPGAAALLRERGEDLFR